VLSVFGDESADETKQRVFAVAALIGSEEAWSALVKTWHERTGGKEFHATECETEYADDPDLGKHKHNLLLYADLTQLIVSSELHGVGVALDLASQRESFPDMAEDFGYYHCFMHVVSNLVEEAELLNDESGIRDNVTFTFDHRQQSEYNSGVLYDWMVNSVEWKHHNVFMDTKISFESRKNQRIQAADLFARETMKHLDNMVAPKRRPVRRSMEALMACGDRFRFFLFDREWEVQRRRLADGLDRLQQFLGLPDPDEGHIPYGTWLQDNRLHDNMSNRFRFLAWQDSSSLRRHKRT
jgi:hypothetical protein